MPMLGIVMAPSTVAVGRASASGAQSLGERVVVVVVSGPWSGA